MFDIGATELLLIVIVAVVVIGPKDLPRALRTAGQWISKVRRTSNHFKAGVETMIRQAEMEDMEKKWREQNERIMAEHPHASADDWKEPPHVDSSAEAHAQSVTAEDGALPQPAKNGGAITPKNSTQTDISFADPSNRPPP